MLMSGFPVASRWLAVSDVGTRVVCVLDEYDVEARLLGGLFAMLADG